MGISSYGDGIGPEEFGQFRATERGIGHTSQ
jgi:hypothetical protein